MKVKLPSTWTAAAAIEIKLLQLYVTKASRSRDMGPTYNSATKNAYSKASYRLVVRTISNGHRVSLFAESRFFSCFFLLLGRLTCRHSRQPSTEIKFKTKNKKKIRGWKNKKNPSSTSQAELSHVTFYNKIKNVFLKINFERSIVYVDIIDMLQTQMDTTKETRTRNWLAQLGQLINSTTDNDR